MERINHDNEVLLPFKYPIITSYNVYAPILGILSNYEKCRDWMYNYFVSLWGNYENNGIILLKFSAWDLHSLCPFIHHGSTNSDVIVKGYKSVLDYITSVVSLDYYLLTNYDEFFIPHTANYKSRHMNHELLIYGYNKEKEIFNVAEFFQYRKYSFQTVTFREMEDSINGNIELFGTKAHYFQTFKYEDCNYELDLDLLIRAVDDYINSRNTLIDYEKQVQCKKEGTVFGIDNYHHMIHYLLRIRNGEDIIKDIRPFHVLYDHKVMMNARLSFLKERGIVDDIEDLAQEFKKIEKCCTVSRSLFIKYYFEKNNDIIDRIIENMKTVASVEKEAMGKLLELLVAYRG